MPKKTPQDWEDLEQQLYAAGADPTEVRAGARRLLAEARGRQLAEARKSYGLAQREVAARMGISVARVSQIENGEVATLDVVARYVEALGGRLDLVADFGDHTLRMPAGGSHGGVAA
ncbi:MAG TPA: helix-turn-helix transcriptional regulator [Yinghuangia sp.]|nr:helix-turn-helix transcriptional regulator [Yinghuangia sp.]